MPAWRENEVGQRPVRIANVSGYYGDSASEMLKQATLGHIDFITGDYLAEVNIANNAEAFAAGTHPGYEKTAWEGLEQTIDVIAQKQIKVALNGGALNPRGLATKVNALARERGHHLTVAYLSGDDLRAQVGATLPTDGNSLWPHLDSGNPAVKTPRDLGAWIERHGAPLPIVSANAYLGARSIVQAFQAGADIVICGRVSDASPVMAAAWYWYSWDAEDYDELAGSLIAGHLIECSTYVTGANFAGFTRYPQESLMDPGFPIAEVRKDGSCVITKHPGTGGFVNVDTVKCQLVYELQGNVYLHSDCKAVLDDVYIEEIGQDRVLVTGIRGRPPPSTTKVAVFYKGGYMCEILFNANGYGFAEKCNLLESQIRSHLSEADSQKLDVLEFQRIGVPASDPRNQNSDTMYLRVVVMAREEQAARFHASQDVRTTVPRPILTYYPALWEQTSLDEQVHILDPDGSEGRVFAGGHPPVFEDLGARDSHETAHPIDIVGPFRRVLLGDVVLARSGDKGSNANIGICVGDSRRWDWLRSFMTGSKMRELVGDDWRDDFSVERVELPRIYTVHFVIYGILGRGVSSSTRLDGLGKGFADYIRNKVVEVPEAVLL